MRTGERRQVSNNGGVQPAWRKDNRELFYLSLDGTVMSVPVKPGPPLETGIPQPLFPTRIPVNASWDQFAVTGDGQRFLLMESPDNEAAVFKVVLNWPALKK